MPLFVLAGLLTAAILLAVIFWPGDSVSPPVIGHLATYLALLVWAATLLRWAYLTSTIAYRLTSQRLFHERGFGHPGPPPLELARIRSVRVEQNFWERWADVGRLHVETDHGVGMILRGVFHPAPVAAEILRHARDARKSAKKRG